MVSLEKRDEMPAYKEEIEATLAEGIAIHNGWGPNRIIGARRRYRHRAQANAPASSMKTAASAPPIIRRI